MCLLHYGACLAQTFFFFLNFLLSIVSLTVIGIGLFAHVQVIKVNDADLQNVDSAPIIVIAVGCVFSGIFFCGCCLAFLRNRCLLITYSVITFILATATVVLTVLIFKDLDADQLKDSAEDVLTETFSNPQNKETLSLMEATLGCCGTTGPEYYNASIPVSCCTSVNIQQDKITLVSITTLTSNPLSTITITCRDSEAYQQGCVDVFLEYSAQIIRITGQVFIWIIVIEYVAASLAMFLNWNIEEEEEYQNSKKQYKSLSVIIKNR